MSAFSSGTVSSRHSLVVSPATFYDPRRRQISSSSTVATVHHGRTAPPEPAAERASGGGARAANSQPPVTQSPRTRRDERLPRALLLVTKQLPGVVQFKQKMIIRGILRASKRASQVPPAAAPRTTTIIYNGVVGRGGGRGW